MDAWQLQCSKKSLRGGIGLIRLAMLLAAVLLAWVAEPKLASGQVGSTLAPQNWKLTLENRIETGPGSNCWIPQQQSADWMPARTAVIVCDVWDYHHSINAVRRLNEMAPRLDAFVAKARASGATIIHAPSDCMAAYESHPARQRALDLAKSVQEDPPQLADQWNHGLPAEKTAKYPVDQSDGGEDDDPTEHAAWAKQLEALGRNPGMPWKAQSPLVRIDSQTDLITDSGSDVWKILRSRGIEQVMLVGVHTNMCVLGRPFGLRQLVGWGKRTLLVSDLTDTMYNPARWPFVSHFAGTDLVIEYIQQYVCPTITSDQLLGGRAFRYSGDRRPTLALMINEDEYQTRQSLPEWVEQQAVRDRFRVVLLHAKEQMKENAESSPPPPRRFHDLSALEKVDALLVSIRRVPLPQDQLEAVQCFVRSGKPVIGIRTASHAFSARDSQAPPEGWGWWPEFDQEVFGGNYRGHHGNELHPKVMPAANRAAGPHPLLAGGDFGGYQSNGSLYRTSPLSPSADVFLMGEVDGQSAEPVAWTFVRRDGGRSFYTSLGHVDDFKQPVFQRLLLNACLWAVGLPLAEGEYFKSPEVGYWRAIRLPVPADELIEAPAGEANQLWSRCFVKFRNGKPATEGKLNLGAMTTEAKVWVNGKPLSVEDERGIRVVKIPAELWSADDANLFVVRVGAGELPQWKSLVPTLALGSIGWRLEGNWQMRWGRSDEPLEKISLPPRFGGSANVVFEF
jgi:nicotinamidase-related amidase/type 1 glutamine amidotransferase